MRETIKEKKVIDLGLCPRCKEAFAGMMTRALSGVKFCYLCSFDLEESAREKKKWTQWAKEYQREMK
jgi:hypothetical protein